MSNTRGIFESSASPEGSNPFGTAAQDSGHHPSPFAPLARADSPFAAVEDVDVSKYEDGGRISKLPERRRLVDPAPSPIDGPEGFGFEAPSQPFGTLPFHPLAPSPFVPVTSPQAIPVQQVQRPVATPVESIAAPEPFAAPQPGSFVPPTWPATGTGAPSISQSKPAAYQETDSSSIRQIELRAIFGLDREMSHEEILQRARNLSGIRHCARVSPQDIATIDATRQVLASLGFNTGSLNLSIGNVPVDFIREGNVLLAIQTEGSFAPGVRETLMLIARELGRTA